MRNPAFVQLIDEIKALHESKNSDYAADADPLSNLRKCEAFGIPAFKGVLVRLTDKWSRIEQLASGKTPKHESLRDSLIDNAVYSLLAVLLLEEAEPLAVKAATARPCDVDVTETVPHGHGFGAVISDQHKAGPRK